MEDAVMTAEEMEDLENLEAPYDLDTPPRQLGRRRRTGSGSHRRREA